MDRKLLSFTFCLVTFALLSACGSKSPAKNKLQQNTAVAPKIESSLTFNNVSLEQADEQGRPLWKVKAKQGIYSQDKKQANIENPSGDLFQDGKLVLQVSANKGEVQQDGKKLFLKGQVVATDPRNGAVLRGDELEWRPKEDILIVRNNLTGSHPQLQASAKEGRYFTRAQRMELQGQIVAMLKDPLLQLRTEHLIWQIPQQKVMGDQRIQIDRYKDKTLTEQVIGNRSEVNLKTKTVTLRQNVQMTSLNPPIQMTSNSATWNLNTQMVVSNQPVTISHRQEQVTMRANQGQVNLQQKVALFIGDVQGVSSRNQAELKANQLRWDIPTQQIKAEGKVTYQQVNPPLSLTGSVGVGRLQDQTFIVTGGNSGRVVTEIIP